MPRTIHIHVNEPDKGTADEKPAEAEKTPLTFPGWFPKRVPRAIPPWTILEAQRGRRIAGKAAKEHKKLVIAAAVILLIIAGSGIYLLVRPPAAGTANQQLSEKVAKLANIPGETNPAIVEVLDAARINQPFLKEARNGDKVVLFYIAKKAVVYRPAANKVIKVGNFDPPLPKVFVRQGSAKSAVSTVQQAIKDQKSYNLTSTDQSPNLSYQGITIVDITHRYPAQLQDLAASLHAAISGLPSGETTPEADFLVIAGQ